MDILAVLYTVIAYSEFSLVFGFDLC
jgi:hypothetical protein